MLKKTNAYKQQYEREYSYNGALSFFKELFGCLALQICGLYDEMPIYR